MKAIIFIVIALNVVACGQKGALYLPQKTTWQVDGLPKAEKAEQAEVIIGNDPNDF